MEYCRRRKYAWNRLVALEGSGVLASAASDRKGKGKRSASELDDNDRDEIDDDGDDSDDDGDDDEAVEESYIDDVMELGSS